MSPEELELLREAWAANNLSQGLDANPHAGLDLALNLYPTLSSVMYADPRLAHFVRLAAQKKGVKAVPHPEPISVTMGRMRSQMAKPQDEEMMAARYMTPAGEGSSMNPQALQMMRQAMMQQQGMAEPVEVEVAPEPSIQEKLLKYFDPRYFNPEQYYAEGEQ